MTHVKNAKRSTGAGTKRAPRQQGTLRLQKTARSRQEFSEAASEFLKVASPRMLRTAATALTEAIHAHPADIATSEKLALELTKLRKTSNNESISIQRTMDRASSWRGNALAGTLETSEVMSRLNISRQAIHERLKNGQLLGVKDHAKTRFPSWQLDERESNWVLAGLPEVLSALDESIPTPPLVKASWFTRPNGTLGGVTPVEALKAKRVAEVVAAARAVSAD